MLRIQCAPVIEILLFAKLEQRAQVAAVACDGVSRQAAFSREVPRKTRQPLAGPGIHHSAGSQEPAGERASASLM